MLAVSVWFIQYAGERAVLYSAMFAVVYACATCSYSCYAAELTRSTLHEVLKLGLRLGLHLIWTFAINMAGFYRSPSATFL